VWVRERKIMQKKAEKKKIKCGGENDIL